MATSRISSEKLAQFRRGLAIPASPLALDAQRKLNIPYQQAIYRYYVDAGAGGIAIGVHTTQFEIRDPHIGLFEPVLALAAETIHQAEQKRGRSLWKIAGVCGLTLQAVREASYAASQGYDAMLLSLGALRDADEEHLLAHCRTLAEILPLIGFYLQPAVGGRALSYAFWRRFAEIEGVVAIKIAPFDRYKTLDVVRAVAMAGREESITLYTGNDDSILMDLLTPFTVQTPEGRKTLRIRGGLLGQWAVWTSTAVKLLEEVHAIVDAQADIPQALLRKHAELTDANAVVFDAAHQFAGCIPGINEVLRRQGLLQYSHCLNPHEILSPGQAEELDRIGRDYPWLNDNAFVRAHLPEWLDS